MGSQQMLLIVVGIIAVGVMIVVGFDISRKYMENSNRDQIIAGLYDLGLMAQQYYKKPIENGGGNGEFTGWVMPEQLKQTHSGKFTSSVKIDRVDLSAEGTEIGRNGLTEVRVTARVDKDGIRITVIN